MLVVDASVALKWFLPGEPGADRAISLLRDGAVLIAPDIVVAEICNGAWRSARLGRITEAQVAEIASVLPRFFDALIGTADLARRAVAIAAEVDHPVYDCLYLALAELRQTSVVTADQRLLGRLHDTPWAARASDLAEYPIA